MPKPMSIKIIHRRERTQKATEREKDMRAAVCFFAACVIYRVVYMCVFSLGAAGFIFEINALSEAGKRLELSRSSRALNGQF